MKNSFDIPIWALCTLILFLLPVISFGQKSETLKNSVSRTIDDNELEWGRCPDFMPDGCTIAVLQGDPAKENVDVFFKVPANSDITKHWHTSAERMVLVAGELEVTYKGEAPRLLKKGSYAYGPAKKPHSAKCGDQGPCVLFIAFEEPLDAFVVEDED
jgi:quercetin dioxygenase-like cupin family protein